MQRLEVSGAVRPIYGSLGVKRLRDSRLDVKYFTLCDLRQNSTEPEQWHE